MSTTIGTVMSSPVLSPRQEKEIETRMKEMKPENVEVLQDLLAAVRREREEELRNREYTWLEDCDINMWKFQQKYPGLMMALQDELDATIWEEVAAHLGLSYQQIERCRKCNNGSYTQEMFRILALNAHHRDLTLKTILEVLLELERHDILRRLQGIDCLKMTENFSTKTFTLSIQRQPEVLVVSANKGVTSDSERKPSKVASQLTVRVLIVHASDATDDALKLAEQLRGSACEERSIRVLMLQETENDVVKTWLEIDPWNSIYKWFMSVDVVVPVLSPQFLRQIHNRDSDSKTKTEQRYNRYIYRLLLDQYVECGSKNYSCRAVFPLKYKKEVMNSRQVQISGLFMAKWNCTLEKDMETFVKLLYDGTITVRKMKKRWKREQKLDEETGESR